MKLGYWFGSIVIICALFFVGCATTGQQSKIAKHPEFAKMCAQCHTLAVVDEIHKLVSKDEMKQIVEKMAKKHGSGIDMNSIDDIVNQIY
jgi:hypothetical protein